MTKKQLRGRIAELELERAKAALGEPVLIRTLTIRFEDRTVTIGRSTFTSEHPAVTIPLVTTERVLVPDGLREVYGE